jgi:mRNA interferase RelE/StbE
VTESSSPRAFVRLTEAAVEDLRALNRLDPQIVRWALKKMLLLERDPMAGEPLVGHLIGFRKLIVSNRTWRIIWRVTTDDVGRTVVDIAEVWAVGARSDGDVYAEMRERLARAGSAPHLLSLRAAVDELARATWDVAPAIEPEPSELPEWLVMQLTTIAGHDAADVQRMSLQQAVDAWTAWISRPR